MLQTIRDTNVYTNISKVGPLSAPKASAVTEIYWSVANAAGLKKIPMSVYKSLSKCITPVMISAKAIALITELLEVLPLVGAIADLAEKGCVYLRENPDTFSPYLKDRVKIAQAGNAVIQGIALTALGCLLCLATGAALPIVFAGALWTATGAEQLYQLGASAKDIGELAHPKIKHLTAPLDT